ncbi:RecBCD enzyme subunit RecD [Candidatus Mikella endobia]|uniref:RecBCD enzyme subunit RecD n=1 Tax=Candidatus Mikella endobia TaxID=1778264 RepID=A0A143WQM1_9ENTR|nr:exodeoxyribonuclease V subunit alpha [Candidatus Mikella endobia]CUX96076.1 RecBCD enzyme subunit RecD [Candidatus Mikella endobia]
MENILFQAQQFHLLRPLDVQFARLLATKPTQSALMLASACLSANTGVGHVCLPLSLLTPSYLFEGHMPQLAHKAWLRAGSLSLKEWHQKLLEEPAVGDGSYPTPLILENKCLYLQRMWQYECTVAKFFNRQRRTLVENNEDIIASVLARYFPIDIDSNEINWQKIATAIAITHPIAFISGGPGTGKTSLIAKLLAVFLQLNEGMHLRIMMAAPTGKAAARMSESLNLEINNLVMDKYKKDILSHKAVTLHRLLGIRPNSQRMYYHCHNKINVDILIIDEASMVDLPMIANVIAALPPQARVIFIGDSCQLSSVDAGSVLRDLCSLETGYSSVCRAKIARITGFKLPAETSIVNNYAISDSICLLHKSYRFHEDSGINRIANAIKYGNADNVFAILNNIKIKDIDYTLLCDKTAYQNMLNDCIDSYKEYLQLLHNYAMPAAILDAFHRFRILCALREGPFGVSGINARIEQKLMQSGLLTIDNSIHCYTGRPVMILCNAPSLELYNGDIGILLLDDKQKRRVYFSLPNGKIKAVPLSRLPEHETAFAMTIHKSQGSEFQHIAIVLPDKIWSVLTRELLYTAVTRARTKLSIYATDKVLQYIIKNKTIRHSGLIDRLTILPTT